jgi:hypothetical protein
VDARLRSRDRVTDALLGRRRQPCRSYSDAIGDNPLFWQLVDRADPDQIRIYTGSIAELEELDPDI